MAADLHIVVDLGFGDSGKGTVVDALTRKYGGHTVVRFNGTGQAGHNVITADGRHHTFAQFGAGSFVPGVVTYLTPQFVVHPSAFLVEARYLERAGVSRPLERVHVAADCTVIAPYHQAANRLRELARGKGRHGSCGVGLGEAMAQWTESYQRIRMANLREESRSDLMRRLRMGRDEIRSRLEEVLRVLRGNRDADTDRAALESDAVLEAWVDATTSFIHQVKVLEGCALSDSFNARLALPGAVIFEGAQGILLDEWKGFHPYTTWSTTTSQNVKDFLYHYANAPIRSRTTWGVMRTYLTRHGAGPLPTEDATLTAALAEPHNVTGTWQGAFRAGWLDLALLRYAIEANEGVDALAVTHMDRLPLVTRRYADGYVTPWGVMYEVPHGPKHDLEFQAVTAGALARATPCYADAPKDAARFCKFLAKKLDVPVRLTSTGPRAEDKIWHAE
jgi:adenylosuccinate synthase